MLVLACIATAALVPIAVASAATSALAVAITISPAGGGKVSDDLGNVCPTGTGSCAFSVDKAGTVVVYTATAASGYSFDGWSGACKGQGNPCKITIDADTTVGVTFTADTTPPPPPTPIRRRLEIGISGAGSVTSVPVGIACGSDCAATFPTGTLVQLVARAETGWRFARWAGSCTGTGGCTLTMDADEKAVAEFVEDVARLTLAVSGGGLVVSSPAGIDCGRRCAMGVPTGTLVLLRAVRDTGYVFSGWRGAGCSGTGSCAIRMDGDRSIGAAFSRRRSGSVRVVVVGDGQIAAPAIGIRCGHGASRCTASAPPGDRVTLTAVGSDARQRDLLEWQVSGCRPAPSCTFLVDGDEVVTAVFGPWPRLAVSWSRTYRSQSGQGLSVSAPGMSPTTCYSGSRCAPQVPPYRPVSVRAVGLAYFENGSSPPQCRRTRGCELRVGPAGAAMTAELRLPPILQLSAVGQGTVTTAPAPLGGNAPSDRPGRWTRTYFFDLGVRVELRPVQAAGWRFDRWTGVAGCAREPICVVRIPSRFAIVGAAAVFVRL